jgi:STE24 endopeptidase
VRLRLGEDALARSFAMQLALILAVLGALAFSDGIPVEPVGGTAWRLAAAMGGVAGVVLFAMVVSRWTVGDLRRNPLGRREVLRRFLVLRRVHLGLWLAAVGGISYGLEWGRLVRFDWHLDAAFLVDEILILAPVVVPLVLSWAAFYDVERMARVGIARDAALAPDAGSRTLVGTPFSSRARYLDYLIRHHLGILLVPLLALLGAQDAARLLLPWALEDGHAALVFLPPLVAIIVLFPWILRGVWRARPLPPGSLRNRLEAASRRCGFHAADILLWPTDGLVANAAVAGFVPQLRYVFLSDGLLARLSEDEIEAVFGHELGHVSHHHLFLRGMAKLAPIAAWTAYQTACPEMVEWLGGLLAGSGPGGPIQTGLVTLLGFAGYVALIFGFYSRILERQADLFGCRAVSGGWNEGIATFVSALEKLAPESGNGRGARGWLHSSIARRVDFLERVAQDPGFEGRFQWRVRLLGALFVVGVAGSLAYQVFVGQIGPHLF